VCGILEKIYQTKIKFNVKKDKLTRYLKVWKG